MRAMSIQCTGNEDIKMLRLRELREERGLTQAQVAEAIGVTTSAYRMYENGSRPLPIKCLINLAYFYHVSADYILGLTA
jgi:transcriptional regulator with XRE-family HTH domain